MPLPYMSPGWVEQRETGRRNRRIVDLEAGFRYWLAAGDHEKCREIDRKINELRRNMTEEAE